MALITIPVHGEILAPVTNVPAVGTVTFKTLIELRDVVDNIVYTPQTFVATLDVNGEFTINLPTTDNPDIDPLNWVYQAFVNTTTWRETFYFQLPFVPGTTEFADLTPLIYDPCVGTPASVPVPVDQSDLFVLKSGDTMTGNLVINANLQVAGSAAASYQGVSGDIMRLLSTAISTGITAGGTVSINANPALIDIGPTEGWVTDYNSTSVIGPANPTITYISFAGQVGLAPLLSPATYWMLNSAGTVVAQSTPPTPNQYRTHLYLATSITIGGVVVAVRNLPVVQSQPGAQLVDLMSSLGAFNITPTGNTIAPNGANLSVNTNGGDIFIRSYGVNAGTYLSPHITTLSAQTPATFRRATATTVLAPFVNTIDVANYDPGGAGVVTPIGGGANTSTIHRVYVAGSPVVQEQIIVQYGQVAYSSLAAAVAAIGAGSFIVNPLFTGTLTGYIVATRTAVALNNPAQATFIHAGKFAAP